MSSVAFVLQPSKSVCTHSAYARLVKIAVLVEKLLLVTVPQQTANPEKDPSRIEQKGIEVSYLTKKMLQATMEFVLFIMRNAYT